MKRRTLLLATPALTVAGVSGVWAKEASAASNLVKFGTSAR
jgi:hypothetical protein